MNSDTQLKDFLIKTKPKTPIIPLPKKHRFHNTPINDTIKPLTYQDYDPITTSSSNRIIYYYQTLNGLQDILNEETTTVTHIHLASFHFGYNPDNTPYLHLNDNPPQDPKFDKVWDELAECKKKGIKIICMLGGAGGAFTTLFHNYEIFMELWYKFIISKSDLIDGVDFDIEEGIGLTNILKLIRDTMNVFDSHPKWKEPTTGLSNFIIAMAPVSYSLEGDTSGMGGFSYKELYQHPEGQRVNYFNGQFYYGDFDLKHFKQCVDNGFPANKIVMGCIENQFTDWVEYYLILEKVKLTYPDFGGVFFWEYFQHPTQWDYNVWLAFRAGNPNTTLNNFLTKNQLHSPDENNSNLVAGQNNELLPNNDNNPIDNLEEDNNNYTSGCVLM